MMSKRTVVALAAAYLVLVSVVFLSDQVLQRLFPAVVPLSRLVVYRGIIFAVFLGAFMYGIVVIFMRVIKKEKAAREDVEKDLSRQISYTAALSQAITETNSRLDPIVVQDFICKEMVSALGVNAAVLTIYEPHRGVAELASAYGLPKEFSHDFRPAPFAANAAHLVACNDPIVVFSDDKDLSDLPNSRITFCR